jgi:16S rRNA C1402 N4-methylase RsmH
MFRPLTRKPLEADEAEQTENPRSRSAKLRAVEKI